MQTTYRMNADDLNPDFVESLKILFRHKQIEITVHETDTLKMPNEQTKAAMIDVRAKKNLQHITLEQLQTEVETQ